MLRVDGKTIALATSCSLNTTTQTTDARTKDDATGPAAEFDFVDWTASSENVVGYNETVTTQEVYDTLLDYQLAGKVVEISLDVINEHNGAIPAGDWQTATEKQADYTPRKGNALIESINLNAPNEGNATISISFKAVGPLSKAS